MPSDLLSPHEAICYRLYYRTPGLTQTQLAKKLQLSQPQISRILEAAAAKVEQLKALCDAGGGDSNVVEQYLAQLEERGQIAPLCA